MADLAQVTREHKDLRVQQLLLEFLLRLVLLLINSTELEHLTGRSLTIITATSCIVSLAGFNILRRLTIYVLITRVQFFDPLQ